MMRDRTTPVAAIAKELGLHRATVYTLVDPHGQPTALGLALLGQQAEAEAAD